MMDPRNTVTQTCRPITFSTSFSQIHRITNVIAVFWSGKSCSSNATQTINIKFRVKVSSKLGQITVMSDGHGKSEQGQTPGCLHAVALHMADERTCNTAPATIAAMHSIKYIAFAQMYACFLRNQHTSSRRKT